MNLYSVLIVGLALLATGCAEKEQTVAEPVDEAPAPTDKAAAPSETDDSWRNDEFLEHMHLHAEKLDDVRFALADGDLGAAKTPAYWLSRHDTFDGVQQEWLQYLYAMRSEAEAVQAATDLETARAAAERINAQCQGCHAAAGMSTQ